MQNKSKKIKWSVFFILIAILIIFVFDFENRNQTEQQNNNQDVNQDVNQDKIENPLLTMREVILPTPLILSEKQNEIDALEKEKILFWTNVYRINNNVQELTENEILNQAAQQKIKDMFEKQYFEHISPEGIGAADIVEGLSYKYLMVGENLALGNFKDEKDLVDAWMASQGHRENILNSKFKEIGIAADRGIFNGERTFLAVQIFATPLSKCPLPDEELKKSIEEKEKELDNLQNEINLLEDEIESLKKEQEMVYNQGKDLVINEEIEAANQRLKELNDKINLKIQKYNQSIIEFNNLTQEVEDLISRYNLQVNNFNQCLTQ
ncbi:MAG TPA: CAP domain-containing protein [Candidatus Paceibacterota bacterium]|nr:CAP domain-containing protein [Candidatus Paceibacterota bacterium]